MDGVTNVWPSVRIGTGDGILYNRGVNSVEAVYMSEHLSGKNYNTFNPAKRTGKRNTDRLDIARRYIKYGLVLYYKYCE